MPTGDIAEVLVDEERLRRRVRELGEAISRDYRDVCDLLLVAVLKGSVMFLADLMRALTVSHAIDFMATSSYADSSESSGIVRILKDLDVNIEGRHVLVVEDIVDTGHTLDYLLRILAERRPASLKVCALLNKSARREVDIHIDYIGFDIPNKFVVGYGLDFCELYRNLPYIGVLREELYSQGGGPRQGDPPASPS
jgi:hypoxanthine phosphoribosyltransferase